jgi:hypothetical protein
VARERAPEKADAEKELEDAQRARTGANAAAKSDPTSTPKQVAAAAAQERVEKEIAALQQANKDLEEAQRGLRAP